MDSILEMERASCLKRSECCSLTFLIATVRPRRESFANFGTTLSTSRIFIKEDHNETSPVQAGYSATPGGNFNPLSSCLGAIFFVIISTFTKQYKCNDVAARDPG